MFKRGAALATARSPVASRTPLSGSGEERTARGVDGAARGRLAVGQVDVCCGACNGEVACRVKNSFVRQRRGVEISKS